MENSPQFSRKILRNWKNSMEMENSMEIFKEFLRNFQWKLSEFFKHNSQESSKENYQWIFRNFQKQMIRIFSGFFKDNFSVFQRRFPRAFMGSSSEKSGINKSGHQLDRRDKAICIDDSFLSMLSVALPIRSHHRPIEIVYFRCFHGQYGPF